MNAPPSPGPAPAWPPDAAGGRLGDGRFASATHHPGSVAEARDLVRAAGAAGLAVYPQGGGTALDVGGVPARPGVAIRTGRLDGVVDYPVADMTITVGAGITLAAVRDLVGRAGQRLAVEAAHPDRATLGGIFAAAATGPRRFGWGRPRDQVIGIAFVDGAGELIRGGGRVVKNVAGYDLPKLLTGSMGTLGLIAELTLKVNPRPAAAALVRADFAALPDLAAALDRLNVSGTRPVALEVVDAATAGAGRGGGWALLVGCEGNAAAVDWQVRRLGADLDRADLEVVRDAAAEAGWLAAVADEAAAPGEIGFAASFAPTRGVEFLRALDPARWSIRSHAGNGVVRGVARVDDAAAGWERELGRLRAEADRLGGALTLPRCPTAWKERLGVWGPRRPDWAIAERVKLALDPGRVLNPGRFVGAI